MRPAPRKFSSEEAVYTAALRALMRRAYSVFEMRTYLERRSENASLARRVVARLKQEQLIDDARYALEFARNRANSRRQGRYRIARELRARGVPDRHITGALDRALAETDETLVVGKLIERRLRAARSAPDEKKIASLYRMLLRAGFDAQLVRQELRKVARDRSAGGGNLPKPDLAEEDS